MSTLPLTVSVVIGVYNGADKIGACLESLLKQNYPAGSYEIIVVENGSMDNTVEVVKQYPVQLYQNNVRGLASARNFGLAKSNADIIATTDADCIADPNWLSELVKPYADPEIGGAGGNILAFDHVGRNIVERFSDEKAPLVNFISGRNEFLPHLCGANASFRRKLVVAIGGFNLNLLTGEDVELSWRIQLETGAKLAYAADAIIYHHHRTNLAGLARLYRQYGFGEIVLDTIFGHYPGYPRTLNFQLQRIGGQAIALLRYLASAMLWQWRRVRGHATPYQFTRPLLYFLIEASNIRGKIDGLIATRGMRNTQFLLRMDAAKMVQRLYGGTK